MVNLSKPSKQDNIVSFDEQKETYDQQTKVFFITQNDPIKYGMTHEAIIELVHKTFYKNGLVYWCMVDEQGSCYHTHIYILLNKKKRWSAVRRKFPHAHLEASVKGSPQENRAYLLKEGDKHKTKIETNFPDTFYEEGELPKYSGGQTRAETLLEIQRMIDDGLRPEEIFKTSILFRQDEAIVRRQFFAKRFAETPPHRDIEVVWHLGASGSGKSYSYVQLCEKFGADEVFYASDYANRCTALLDNYEAQKVLFLDEVKEDSFTFGYLLQLLQGYRTPIHARYANVMSLWDRVDITSIFTPKQIYEGMVSIVNRDVDTEYQLLRRITKYIYHWKTEDGMYHEYEIPASEFKSYEELKQRAEGISKEADFEQVDETPFK